MNRTGVTLLLALALAAVIAGSGCGPDTGDTTADWVEVTAGGMSDADKVGQLFCLTVDPIYYFLRPDYKQAVDRLISRYQPGAVFFTAEIDTVNLEIQYEFNGDKLHTEVVSMQALSRVPLIVSATFESGAWFWDITATRFPSPLALGAARSIELAYRQGKITAVEALAQGITFIHGPVAGITGDPDDIDLQMNAYGVEQPLTGNLATQYLTGIDEAGAASCFRFFPDERTNSILTVLPADVDPGIIEGLKGALQTDLPAIMISPVDTAELSGRSGDISTALISTILREQLGYTGILMGSIATSADPSAVDRERELLVSLLDTGPAMFILPEIVDDRIPLIDSFLQEVADGAINMGPVDAAARKILALKRRLNLNVAEQGSELNSMAGIGLPEYHTTSRQISEASVTLLGNADNVLPIDVKGKTITSVSFLDTFSPLYATMFDSALDNVSRDIHSINVFGVPDVRIEREILIRAAASDIMICSFFIKKGSLDRTPGFEKELLDLMRRLSAASKSVVVISFYNPHMINDLTDIQGYIIPYGPGEHSIDTVVDVLFGRAGTPGTLPIRISDRYPVGSGIFLGGD